MEMSHNHRLYDLLARDAVDGVWRGWLMDLAREMDLKQPYLSQMLKVLERCGAIERISRSGSRVKPSVVALKSRESIPNGKTYVKRLPIDRRVNHEDIVAGWRAGATKREIANNLGWTTSRVRQRIHRLQLAGILEYRGPGPR